MKQPGLFDFSERQKKLLKTRDFLERVSLLVAWKPSGLCWTRRLSGRTMTKASGLRMTRF